MRNNCRLPVDEQFEIRFPRGRHAGRSSHFEVRIALNHTNEQRTEGIGRFFSVPQQPTS